MKTQNVTSTNQVYIPDAEYSLSLERPADPPGIAGLTGNPDGTAEPSSSMAIPVTRHALNPPADNYELLNCGIDSLDLGLFVTWNDQ